jgi:hypothetical protein
MIILVPGDRENGKGDGDAEQLISQTADGHPLDGEGQALMVKVQIKGEAGD